MGAVRSANDALAFLLELAAVAALAVWGLAVGPTLPVRMLLAVTAPAALIVGWAVWLAPRSDRRLAMPGLLVAKILVFGLAAAALAVSGHPVLGTVLAAAAALNLGLGVAWGRV